MMIGRVEQPKNHLPNTIELLLLLVEMSCSELGEGLRVPGLYVS